MDTFVDYDMLCMWAIFKCVISNSIDMQLFLISQRKLRLDIFKMHEDHLLIWEGEGGGLTVIAPPPHHLTTDGTYNCSSLPYYFLLFALVRGLHFNQMLHSYLSKHRIVSFLFLFFSLNCACAYTTFDFMQ